MNESEWLAGVDPQKMVKHVIERFSDRKLRLFGCACCRQVWDLIPEGCFRDAVSSAEQFADGKLSQQELLRINALGGAELQKRALQGLGKEAYRAAAAAWSTTRNASTAALYPIWNLVTDSDRHWQASLLFEIFGNPFRPPSPRSKDISTKVLDVARMAYERSTSDRLSDLGALLLEAGDCDPALLSHLMDEEQHVKGCWALDRLLDKACA